MTLEEAKKILTKEFATIAFYKCEEPYEFNKKTWFDEEKPEVLEAFRVLGKESMYAVIPNIDVFERNERLKKEHDNPALNESASQFNDGLLDEQAKKIKHLEDYVASRNKIIAEQSAKISSLNAKITKKNKVISKKSRELKDKDAVLSDVAEELRLSKVREEKLTEVCQKYLKEIDGLKVDLDKSEKLRLKVFNSCAEKSIEINKLREQLANIAVNNVNAQALKSAESALCYKDEVIEDLRKELAEAKKMIGWVRNASKEYCDYGVAANEFIKKLSRLYLQAHDEKRFDIEMLMRCKNYQTYGFHTTGNCETQKEINDIARGKNGGIPTPDESKNDDGGFEAFKKRTIERYNKRKAVACGCVGSKDDNGILDQKETNVDLWKGKDYTSHIIVIPKDADPTLLCNIFKDMSDIINSEL